MKKRIRTGVVCVVDNHLLAIELEDPTTKKRFWTVPGGEIEEGETPAEAAVREVFEETGYKASVDEESMFITTYVFRWNAGVWHCETCWFRGSVEPGPPAEVNDATYLLQSRWLPLNRLNALFSYHPVILDAVTRLVANP